MRVLIVDDERGARFALGRLVKSCGAADEVELVEASTRADAERIIGEGKIDLAFLDLRLSAQAEDRCGRALIKAARERGTTAVIVSGYGDMSEVRAAMREGAFDYLLKDELSEELVRPIVEGLRCQRELEHEVIALRARRPDDALYQLVGTGSAMGSLRLLIQRVAASDRPLLVTGPTGSGKELAVRAIHALGRHPDAPLLDLNCGAFPEQLIESLLFGHEKGAFTGADKRHHGFFEAVGQGTLFLDEVGELPLELQAKLLRVLESQTFRPLKFAGRVVAATHVDLEARVRAGTFREDLYYRLNVLEVRIPSLEERREDIPSLVAHFVGKQDRPLELTAEALQLLEAAPWPGNIRQLKNTIDRLAVLAPSGPITPAVLESCVHGSRLTRRSELSGPEYLRELLHSGDGNKLELMEELLTREAMKEAGGNKSGAARLLGVHRKVVERRTERWK
jgi:DNA-binding NtrC family response regulator